MGLFHQAILLTVFCGIFSLNLQVSNVSGSPIVNHFSNAPDLAILDIDLSELQDAFQTDSISVMEKDKMDTNEKIFLCNTDTNKDQRSQYICSYSKDKTTKVTSDKVKDIDKLSMMMLKDMMQGSKTYNKIDLGDLVSATERKEPKTDLFGINLSNEIYGVAKEASETSMGDILQNSLNIKKEIDVNDNRNLDPQIVPIGNPALTRTAEIPSPTKDPYIIEIKYEDPPVQDMDAKEVEKNGRLNKLGIVEGIDAVLKEQSRPKMAPEINAKSGTEKGNDHLKESQISQAELPKSQTVDGPQSSYHVKKKGSETRGESVDGSKSLETSRSAFKNAKAELSRTLAMLRKLEKVSQNDITNKGEDELTNIKDTQIEEDYDIYTSDDYSEIYEGEEDLDSLLDLYSSYNDGSKTENVAPEAKESVSFGIAAPVEELLKRDFHATFQKPELSKVISNIQQNSNNQNNIQTSEPLQAVQMNQGQLSPINMQEPTHSALPQTMAPLPFMGDIPMQNRHLQGALPMQLSGFNNINGIQQFPATSSGVSLNQATRFNPDMNELTNQMVSGLQPQILNVPMQTMIDHGHTNAMSNPLMNQHGQTSVGQEINHVLQPAPQTVGQLMVPMLNQVEDQIQNDILPMGPTPVIRPLPNLSPESSFLPPMAPQTSFIRVAESTYVDPGRFNTDVMLHPPSQLQGIFPQPNPSNINSIHNSLAVQIPNSNQNALDSMTPQLLPASNSDMQPLQSMHLARRSNTLDRSLAHFHEDRDDPIKRKERKLSQSLYTEEKYKPKQKLPLHHAYESVHTNFLSNQPPTFANQSPAQQNFNHKPMTFEGIPGPSHEVINNPMFGQRPIAALTGNKVYKEKQDHHLNARSNSNLYVPISVVKPKLHSVVNLQPSLQNTPTISRKGQSDSILYQPQLPHLQAMFPKVTQRLQPNNNIKRMPKAMITNLFGNLAIKNLQKPKLPRRIIPRRFPVKGKSLARKFPKRKAKQLIVKHEYEAENDPDKEWLDTEYSEDSFPDGPSLEFAESYDEKGDSIMSINSRPGQEGMVMSNGKLHRSFNSRRRPGRRMKSIRTVINRRKYRDI